MIKEINICELNVIHENLFLIQSEVSDISLTGNSVSDKMTSIRLNSESNWRTIVRQNIGNQNASSIICCGLSDSIVAFLMDYLPPFSQLLVTDTSDIVLRKFNSYSAIHFKNITLSVI